jgi:endonuclease/exonuclease/phosphatase (EEP) superfamily protein YafD
VDFAHDGLPSIVATIDAEGHTVRFFGLHTRWPIAPDLQRSRDRTIEAAAAAARAAAPTSAILAGDLNLTPFAPEFTRLLARSGLRDAFAGVTWRPTWRAEFWPLALPIDHVLVPVDACVVRREIGEATGSDHRPVLVTVRWRE